MTNYIQGNNLPNRTEPSDVRYDSIGQVNRFINWVFTGKKPKVIRRALSLFLHIELPQLQHPVRMSHSFGITINSGAKMGRNVTIFQCVTVGSKRHDRNAGVPVIEDDVVIYPNAVIVGEGAHRRRSHCWARCGCHHQCARRRNSCRQSRANDVWLT